MAVNPIRDGFRSITPYLFVTGALHLLEFLSAATSGGLHHMWKTYHRKSNSDAGASFGVSITGKTTNVTQLLCK